MHAGHKNIVCPSCDRRVGGCRCPMPGKTVEVNSEPCRQCKVVNVMAEAFEDAGCDLDSIGEHYVTNGYIPPPVPPAKKYVEKGRENDLTDEMLDNMDSDSSWHGFTEMGSFRSIDSELHSGRRMQDHIPRLVAEIRRLRALVPEDQRVVSSAPTAPAYQPPAHPIPKPPFNYPGAPR